MKGRCANRYTMETKIFRALSLFGKKSFANTMNVVNILYTYLFILSMGKSPTITPNKIMNIISMKLLYCIVLYCIVLYCIENVAGLYYLHLVDMKRGRGEI